MSGVSTACENRLCISLKQTDKDPYNKFIIIYFNLTKQNWDYSCFRVSNLFYNFYFKILVIVSFLKTIKSASELAGTFTEIRKPFLLLCSLFTRLGLLDFILVKSLTLLKIICILTCLAGDHTIVLQFSSHKSFGFSSADILSHLHAKFYILWKLIPCKLI